LGGGVRGRGEMEDGLIATNLRRKAFDSCKLSVYIWLLGASSQTPAGLRLWTPSGDFRPSDPL